MQFIKQKALSDFVEVWATIIMRFLACLIGLSRGELGKSLPTLNVQKSLIGKMKFGSSA
jgi:hypothetical protein